MRNIVFIILDKFADWESAFLAAALNIRVITENYTVSYASIDKKIVTAKGDSPVHFAANVMKALGDISEETIGMFYNIYTIGFDKAMMKK